MEPFVYTSNAVVTHDLLGTTITSEGDVDQSQKEQCQMLTFLVTGVLTTCIICIGLTGNTLTMIVLWRDMRQSATMFLLFCLAVADSLVLIDFGIMGLHAYGDMSGNILLRIRMTQLAYAYFGAVSNICLMAAVWLTVLVMWHRYVNVCLPYRAKIWGSLRVARIQVLIVVTFSLLFNVPRFFEKRLLLDYPEPGKSTIVQTDLIKMKGYQVVYRVSLFYICFYILPMLALIYMTFSLILALRRSYQKHQEMTGQTSNEKASNRQEVTLTLIVIVIIFMVCHSLSPLRRIFAISKSTACGTFYFYFAPWVGIGIVLSSSINFVFYILCVKRFRQKFKGIFTRNSQIQPIDVTPSNITGCVRTGTQLGTLG